MGVVSLIADCTSHRISGPIAAAAVPSDSRLRNEGWLRRASNDGLHFTGAGFRLRQQVLQAGQTKISSKNKILAEPCDVRAQKGVDFYNRMRCRIRT
jgi:hypothetical protein